MKSDLESAQALFRIAQALAIKSEFNFRFGNLFGILSEFDTRIKDDLDHNVA